MTRIPSRLSEGAAPQVEPQLRPIDPASGNLSLREEQISDQVKLTPTVIRSIAADADGLFRRAEVELSADNVLEQYSNYL